MGKLPVKIGKLAVRRGGLPSVVLLSLSLLLPRANYVLAQTAGSTKSKPTVALTVSDKRVAPDQPITFTVTTNINGAIKIDFPTECIVDYGIMNGMEQKMDPATGKIKTYYYVQQNGSFHKKGSYTCRAFVNYKGHEYQSNKIIITVTEDAENEDNHLGYHSKDPIFGVIQARKTTVYEGEPVLLKAKVFSKLDVFFLDAYSPFKPDKNAESHVFQNQKYALERARLNGKDVLTFEYGKQLLFPVGTGKCKIQPFEMSLRCHGSIFDRTVNFRSSSTTITIKPLPDGAPKDFIGGVGKYTLTQQLGKSKMRQDEVYTLTLTVAGIGNLHNTNAPVLDLPAGCTVYGDPEREENYTYTEDGVEGSITYRYNIQVTKSGKISFAAPSISYFSPATEGYVTVKTEPFSFEVEADPSGRQVVDQTHPNDKQAPLDPKSSNTTVQNGKRKGPGMTLVLGIATPVAALSLVLLLFLGKRKKGRRGAPSLLPEALAAVMPKPEQVKTDYWSEAAVAVNDSNRFAILLPKAIIQQLEKHLELSGLSREKVLTKAADKHPQEAAALRAIIDTCDQYRYGFGDVEMDPPSLLETTRELLDVI